MQKSDNLNVWGPLKHFKLKGRVMIAMKSWKFKHFRFLYKNIWNGKWVINRHSHIYSSENGEKLDTINPYLVWDVDHRHR